jgi:hypothetical protein
MTIEHKSEEPVRAYLLGTLAEQESVALEERYFSDRAFFLWVQAVEVGLIEDYLDNRLPASARELFESRYLLVPDLRKRLDEVRSQRATVVALDRRQIALAWQIAAVALVCVAGLSTWLLLRQSGQPFQVAHNERPSAEITIALRPGVAKGDGEGVAQFVLPSQRTPIRLSLELLGSRADLQYQVELFSISLDGQPNKLWRSAMLSASAPVAGGRTVSCTLDSTLLARGDYLVHLATPDGSVVESYTFRVTSAR